MSRRYPEGRAIPRGRDIISKVMEVRNITGFGENTMRCGEN